MATRSKTATPRKAASATKPNAGATKPTKPSPASSPAPQPEPQLATATTDRVRRGDLLDAMSERSQMRRADLKVIMELVLEEMGRLIDEGDEVVLPPLGKIVVKKRVPRDGGDVLTVKLKRQPSGATDPKPAD